MRKETRHPPTLSCDGSFSEDSWECQELNLVSVTLQKSMRYPKRSENTIRNCINSPQNLFSVLISASSLSLIHCQGTDCFLCPRVLSSTPILPLPILPPTLSFHVFINPGHAQKLIESRVYLVLIDIGK